MIKRILTGIVLSFVMVMTFAPLTYAFEYEDVPRGSTYFYPVDYLRRNDVFKDTRYFYPDLLISKAEFIKYLVLLNSPGFRSTGYAELPFEDTRNNAWYASYFKEAIDLGILSDRDLKVYPDKKISVIEALELLFHSQSIPIPNVYKGDIPYLDVARNQRAAPLIMRALSFDIIRPQSNEYVGIYRRVNRAEAARMIYKMDLVNLGSSYSNTIFDKPVYDLELEKIISVWELIDATYIERDELDKTAIADETIRTLVDQLGDPYSTYLDKEDNANFTDDLDGQIEGIGAVIGFNEKGELTVISPIKDSPAERAGIKAKDVILKVDGVDVSGMDLMKAVNLIKGPKGTEVTLTIGRDGGTRIIKVVRDVIIIPSLSYETINDGRIMLVTLSQFNSNATDQFQEVVDVINGSNQIKGLIIDVRDNPGGLLDVSINVISHLIKPQSEVVTIEYADFSQTLYNRGAGSLAGFPMVVIINGGSASASEILAGAVQDYDLATIVGEKSFGKGTVQEVNYFIDDSSIKLTVAKWLTPMENDIQENGITPDIFIEDNESTEQDEQLQRAIIEVNKLINAN